MEKFAYNYAKDKGYAIPTYTDLIDNEVLAMKELFNMTAGTSTGSILAAGLSYPNDPELQYWQDGVSSTRTNARSDQPAFFGIDLVNIYEKNNT